MLIFVLISLWSVSGVCSFIWYESRKWDLTVGDIIFMVFSGAFLGPIVTIIAVLVDLPRLLPCIDKVIIKQKRK